MSLAGLLQPAPSRAAQKEDGQLGGSIVQWEVLYYQTQANSRCTYKETVFQFMLPEWHEDYRTTPVAVQIISEKGMETAVKPISNSHWDATQNLLYLDFTPADGRSAPPDC